MKLGLIKTISRDEIARAGDVPAWLDTLLDPINSFIGVVGKAVQGGLNFTDNFSANVVTQKFTHGVALEINPQSKLKVTGVFPIDANGQGIDSFTWARKTNGNIDVTFRFYGGSGSTEANCTIVILLG